VYPSRAIGEEISRITIASVRLEARKIKNRGQPAAELRTRAEAVLAERTSVPRHRAAADNRETYLHPQLEIPTI
jgi:hypothetical protein